jgi:hypothetical protein
MQLRNRHLLILFMLISIIIGACRKESDIKIPSFLKLKYKVTYKNSGIPPVKHVQKIPRFCLSGRFLPGVGKQLTQFRLLGVVDSCEHVPKPRFGIDVVGFATQHERINHRRALGGLV